MRHWPAYVGLSLLMAACQTAPTRTSSSGNELADAFIKITTAACTSTLGTEGKVKVFLDALDKSPRDVCECTFRKFFGAMNETELDRFLDDAIKYGDRLSEQDPWKKQVVTAMAICMSEATPGLAMRPQR